jgi:hypothetical protein
VRARRGGGRGAEVDQRVSVPEARGYVAELADGLGELRIVAGESAVEVQRAAEAGRRAEAPRERDGALWVGQRRVDLPAGELRLGARVP